MIIDDVAAYIVAAGLGTVVTGASPGLDGVHDIYGWRAPLSKPDACIFLAEYPGIDDPKAKVVSDPMPKWELPRLQITVRGDPLDYAPARLRIEKVRQLLTGSQDVIINGTVYNRFTMVVGVFGLAPDTQNRPLLTVSYEIMKSYTAVTIP